MVTVYRILRITSGGRHAWVESSVGPIRKPLNNIKMGIEREAVEVDEMLEKAKRTFRWKWKMFWMRAWRIIRRCK